MKEVKRYICEGCGDVSQTEDEALRCEEHHKNKDKLKDLEVVMVGMGGITHVPGVREAESRKASVLNNGKVLTLPPKAPEATMMPGTIKIRHAITGTEAWYKHQHFQIGPWS